jgi:hypothetical protein
MQLPEPIAGACAPLFEAVQIDRAMPVLTGSDPKQTALVLEVLKDPALVVRPELAAGLWLYVDDLERSHAVSQGIEGATGAWWHGIMHRREGDFSNSHYWLRRAADHPLMRERPGLDPAALIDAVADVRGGNPPDLLQRQREEWSALFEWCATHR